MSAMSANEDGNSPPSEETPKTEKKDATSKSDTARSAEQTKETGSVTIHSNDRLAVTGKTGTGKTHLVKKLVWNRFNRVVFYDWKWQHYPELNAPVVHTIEEVEDALNDPNMVNKFVYAPKRKGRDVFNRLCYLMWEETNIHLIADELKGIYQENGWVAGITDYHENIMTRGRQKGVGMTNVTQRPKGVPLETLSEAEHFFTFKLNLRDDRKRIGDIIGSEHQHKARELTDHRFIYYNTEMDEPRVCPAL